MRHAASVILLVIAWTTAVPGPHAQPAQEVLGLLQIGSRPSLGIGGDPFLSPFGDESGWWAACRAGAVEGFEFRQLEQAIVTERVTKGRGVASHRVVALSAGHSFVEGPQRVAVVGRLNLPATDTRWNLDGGGIDFSNEGATLTAAARVTDLVPHLELQASGPIWQSLENSARIETGVGARWRWPSFLALQATWTRTGYPLQCSGDFYGEPVALRANLMRTCLRYDARLAPYRWVTGEASLARTWLDELDARSGGPIYESSPGGKARHGQGSLEVHPTPRLRLLGRVARTDLDTDGLAYWGGQLFGRIAYARLNLDSRLLGARADLGDGSTLLADVEWGDLDGRLRLTIESWPFTSAIIDLIGVRKKYLLTAAADFSRWHLGLEQRWGGTRLQGGVNWFDVRPQAHLVTWLSAFMGMGSIDVRHYDLSARRVEMAALSLGAEVPLGRLVGALAVQQFVHVAAYGKRTAGDMPDDPLEPGTPATGDDSGWLGGTVLDLSVRLKL